MYIDERKRSKPNEDIFWKRITATLTITTIDVITATIIKIHVITITTTTTTQHWFFHHKSGKQKQWSNHL